MSKIVKTFKKIGKKIVRGLKKAWKTVTKSTLGKVLLFAATIYLGGAALGAWNSPFASINGALAGGQTAGATATGQGLQAANTANIAAAEAAGGAATAAEGATAIGTAAEGTLATGLQAANTVNVALAETAGGAVQPTGFLNKAMKVATEYGGKAAEFAGENKLLTAMGFQAVAGAASGAAAREAEEEERKRMQQNLSVGNIDLGMSPGARRISTPGASINSRMRG